MKHDVPIFASSAGFVLAIAFSFGAYAQQSVPVAPASSTAAAHDTGINKRDRSDRTLTPTDQSNDTADVKLVAAVRRAVVKDDSLSMSAHNVKMIAKNGVVTLRGPVKNTAEKASVASIAKAVAGVTRVDNELDIKTP